jgi:hypothetical protein
VNIFALSDEFVKSIYIKEYLYGLEFFPFWVLSAFFDLLDTVATLVNSLMDIIKECVKHITGYLNLVYVNWYQEYERPWLSIYFNFFYCLFQEKRDRKSKRRQRYIYQIDIINPERWKRSLPKKYVSIRILRLYYLNYSYRQFRRMAKKISKRDGSFEVNFILALEGRLINAVYRTGLVANIFECMEIVSDGHFLINQSRLGHLNHSIRLTDLLAFSSEYKWILYYRLMSRIARRSILFNAPKYLFVSYKLLVAYFKREPREKDLVFPTTIDIYRATGYLH